MPYDKVATHDAAFPCGEHKKRIGLDQADADFFLAGHLCLPSQSAFQGKNTMHAWFNRKNLPPKFKMDDLWISYSESLKKHIFIHIQLYIYILVNHSWPAISINLKDDYPMRQR